MQITSAQGGKLLEVSSPVAGVAEIDEMAMQGDMMQHARRARAGVPAGKAVELKPGGYHVKLMDLKQQLKPGESVPLTLVVEEQGRQARDGERQGAGARAGRRRAQTLSTATARAD